MCAETDGRAGADVLVMVGGRRSVRDGRDGTRFACENSPSKNLPVRQVTLVVAAALGFAVAQHVGRLSGRVDDGLAAHARANVEGLAH